MKLEYEKKQAALKEEKDKLDSKMNMLDKEKEVAIETVVLETLEAELSDKSHIGSETSIGVIPKKFEFVQSPKPKPPKQDPGLDAASLKSLDPTAKPFEPEIPKQLSTYLLKRDILIEHFNHFDDKPETFNIWKTSFRSILSELNVSPVDEFDLLQKYLGPESKAIAKRIRQWNPFDINRALQLTWERLYERFGSLELIERSLKQRVEKFPHISTKEISALYEQSDLCNEIESTKKDPIYTQLLGYFDSSTGVSLIVEKLPIHIQNKWVTRASNYKRVHSVFFPPFREFCAFLKEMSVMLHDPGLCVSYPTPSGNKNDKRSFSQNRFRAKVHVNKTVTNAFVKDSCPLHGNTKSHNINECKIFKTKSVSERKGYLKDNNICYKCFNDTSHNFNACSFTGRCSECGSQRHPSCLHFYGPDQQQAFRDGDTGRQPPKYHDKEQLPSISSPPMQPPPPRNNIPPVVNGCTNICGNGVSGKSCSKSVLVKVHPVEHPEQAKIVYCIIDDQSNRTLCRTELFQMWNTASLSVGIEEYELISCSGKSVCSGRTVSGLSVSSLDNSFSVTLPAVLECDRIPDTRSEIPTPEITQFHEHLKGIPIPPLQPDVDIILLIERDVPEAHHVYDQRIAHGRLNTPFAQRLRLGWVIIGEMCLNSHRPDVTAMKTYIQSNGRPSIFKSCESKIKVKTRNLDKVEADGIFLETNHDNEIGLSIEDHEFLEIMEQEFLKDEDNHWTAPLPFCTPCVRLPNNRYEAYRRVKSFESSLKRDPSKLQHSLDFMGNLIDKGYCERVSPLDEDEERWYLPLFEVYHAKKREEIRIVFDSSSKFNGVSLNSVLMSGQDLTNNLSGILMRFRKDNVAIMGDIEQMFYQFRVNIEHRNYLRFLWYEDNDFNNPLVEICMCVHVFGNTPSPAVAAYGLSRTAHVAAGQYDEGVINFVDNDFYVDDGQTSVPTDSEAVHLIRNTQQVLQEGHVRFRKIAPNSVEVLACLSEGDLSKDLKHSQIGVDSLPMQRSLGLCWDLKRRLFYISNPRLELNPAQVQTIHHYLCIDCTKPIGDWDPTALGQRLDGLAEVIISDECCKVPTKTLKTILDYLARRNCQVACWGTADRPRHEPIKLALMI